MSLPNFTLITLILAIFIPKFHCTEASGFTIDLIHRDSLHSPSLYSSSSSSQVKTALQRSFSRANSLVRASAPQAPSAEIVPDRGEYLMRFSLGTPKVETLAIADTGSDLTWIQCQPCSLCFKQKSPLFEPKKSSSYKAVSCASRTCSALSRSSCTASTNTCRYTMSYGDRSYSRGELATETITLGGNVSIPRVTIGCGHNDQGTFGGGASGIVGLGGGQVSLIRQLGSSIQGKFSYCLVPLFGSEKPSPSKMSFGDQAVVTGAGVVETPIVSKSPDTFYFLTLEGMTIGAQRFNLLSSSSDEDDDFAGSEEGNIIIDSGTTLTFLPTELYYQVEAEVKRQVSLTEISDPAGLLSVCYEAEGDSAEVPEITAHFRGADLKLKAINTFVKTSQNSLCLAFAPATSLAIYGNLAQMDFLVGYDLEKKTVSFKPTECGKA